MDEVANLDEELVDRLLGGLLLLREGSHALLDGLNLGDGGGGVLLGNLELGHRLVRLVELGVDAVELPALVAPNLVEGDDVVHVLHAREAAALGLPDDLL